MNIEVSLESRYWRSGEDGHRDNHVASLSIWKANVLSHSNWRVHSLCEARRGCQNQPDTGCLNQSGSGCRMPGMAFCLFYLRQRRKNGKDSCSIDNVSFGTVVVPTQKPPQSIFLVYDSYQGNCE